MLRRSVLDRWLIRSLDCFCFSSRFWLMISIFIDIFRSHDLKGWTKAVWVIFVIVFPLIRVLARGWRSSETAETFQPRSSSNSGARILNQQWTPSDASTPHQATPFLPRRLVRHLTDRTHTVHGLPGLPSGPFTWRDAVDKSHRVSGAPTNHFDEEALSLSNVTAQASGLRLAPICSGGGRRPRAPYKHTFPPESLGLRDSDGTRPVTRSRVCQRTGHDRRCGLSATRPLQGSRRPLEGAFPCSMNPFINQPRASEPDLRLDRAFDRPILLPNARFSHA